MPRWYRILRICTASTRNRAKYRLGRIDSFSGSTTSVYTVEDSVRYINAVYQDTVHYGRLTPADIEGKTVVELGPGDNVGVLVRFLGSGAQRVWAADKFYSKHDTEHERQIYLQLRNGLSPAEQRNIDQVVKLEPKLEFDTSRLNYVYKGAQDFDEAVPANTADLIVSRGVLQEVYEIDAAFAAMDRVLKPGGKMVHKIDLRDYGMFSSLGFNPREFLTISEPVYRWMAHDTDKPNRRMLNYYRRKMADMGYQAEFLITGLVEDGGYRGVQPEIHPHKAALTFGVDYHEPQRRMTEEIRPRLAKQFLDLSEQDLLAAATFLIARKPR